MPTCSARSWDFCGDLGDQVPGNVEVVEPVSGFEPLTCRLQDGCSAD
jgi:hypothetical protein